MPNRLYIFSNVVLVLQIFLLLFCFADLNALPSSVLFVGKLHPVILHLPITLILLLLPFSLFVAKRKQQKNITTIFDLMLHCIALVSTLTAITGFFLAAGGGYDADSLVFHKWLGVSIALLSHALIYLNKLLETKPLAWNFVLAFTVLISVAGSHFGGTLTHGDGFFSFSNNRKSDSANKSENEKTYPFLAVPTAVIERMNNPFRRVLKVSAKSPALVVKFSIREKFDIKLLTECNEIAEQITELNLSGMPVDDQVFPILTGFVNLEKLNLNSTSISGDGLKILMTLKKLEQLSVVNTDVDLQEVLPLIKIGSLKHVFIWNTKIREQDLVLLKSKSPRINWEMGYQANKNEILQLPPPYLEDNENLIFENELNVALKNPFPNAKIMYTTDGLAPDTSNSNIYTKAVYTKELLRIKAVTSLDGWITSEVIDFTVYPKGIACDSVTLLSKPNRGKSFGGKILIDGRKGYSQTADQLYNSWLGFKKENFKAGFHFGSNPTLHQIVVSTADMTNSSGASVFPPTKITIKGGNNAKNLKTIGSLSPEMPHVRRPNASIPYVVLIKPGNYAYIEIEMLPLKSLPTWHQEKGQNGYVFLDEVFFY